MRHIETLILAAGIALLSSAAAFANGAEASFPAGGVVFRHEKQISIEREDLDIATDSIHVHYVFRSTASHRLKLKIGFPMPRYSMADDGPDFIAERSASQKDLHDYMAFKVKVNGKPLKPVLHQLAWLGERNVTLELRRMHVPPLTVPEEVGDKTLRRLPKPILNKLMTMKLVEREETNSTLMPMWDYQSVYEWNQTFRPGRTEVDITYVPLTGDGPSYDRPDIDQDGRGQKRYCYDAALKAKAGALLEKNGYLEPLQVGYILKTAKNWNGPIGTLNLTIRAARADLVSFCAPSGLEPAADDRHWTAHDFVPDRDLDMIFFSHYTE